MAVKLRFRTAIISLLVSMTAVQAHEGLDYLHCDDLHIKADWTHNIVPGTRTVCFVDRSYGNISAWKWDFGDGSFSSEQNPVHTYAVDGERHTVTLYVSGPDGESHLCKVGDVCVYGSARTSSSLFHRADSLQVSEISSDKAVLYESVGHHGPAVENAWSAFRIYFNDSGAIDVYSKGSPEPELPKYRWYPTVGQQAEESAGCDEYLVGSTVGLGGIALWDGEREVKLVATKGRTARAGKTDEGSFAEMIAYGVNCNGKLFDISIRIDVLDGDRAARVTARELNGRKVRFLSGVNYHAGESVTIGDSYVSVWGVHPSDVSLKPIPLGAGIVFDKSLFNVVEKTSDMVRIISVPSTEVFTTIVSASTKEGVINTGSIFDAYVRSIAPSSK